MQKFGDCELCGRHKLVANYGFDGEYVCVDCTLSDPKLSAHVENEMIRRHGQAKVQDLVNEVMTEIGVTKH